MEIPVSLRRWFVAHFGVNLLIGAPLVLAPEVFLRAIGWQTVDGASARLGGAALVAVGVQSFLTRDKGPGTLRMMLNFKLLWSWSLIAGLVFAVAGGAPDPVWALLAFFLALSSVWFHYRVQLDPNADDEVEDDEAALPAGSEELSELLHLDKVQGEGNPAKVHPGTSFDSVGADDINALFAAKAAEEAAKAQAERAAQEAQAEQERLAAEAALAETVMPNRTIQGMPAEKRAEMDEIAALLAASESTGIDDAKAERLANMLAARKKDKEAAEAPKSAPPPPAGPEEEAALGGDDIAAMLARGPEEKTLGEDDIAAMLAGGGGQDETNEALGSDDIAAMLAGGGEQSPAQDEQDEPKATEDEAPKDEALGGDDIAAMLAGGGEEAPSLAESPAPPLPDKTLPSEDVAALLAGDEDSLSSEDLAAMLAGNEGGLPEPPPAPPTLRGRVDSYTDELEDEDFGLSITDDTPPPEPTAVVADALAEGDTLDQAADEDAIAALLAASRGNDGPS